MTKSALMKHALAACCLLGVAVAVACSSNNNNSDGGVNCGTGAVQCGDTCTVVARDPQNCGSCGKSCAAGEVCSAGSCASSCGNGTTKCGNECVDNKSDPRNCGSCGKACAANEVCMAGACAASCGMGTTQCGMACVSTQTDRTNCGMCGKTCAAGLACVAGQCTLQCQQGQTACPAPMADGGVSDGGSDGGGVMMGPSTICVDTNTDYNNCGGCGTTCKGACIGGKCAFTFGTSQMIDNQTVTCSAARSNPLYTECDDLKQGGNYMPNGITCGPQWSTQNSIYSDTVGFCRSLTGNPSSTIEVFYVCTSTVTRSTWKNHVWGTFQDNGFTQHVRCFY